jgi:pimeloyl-ACP methyl ester carboxylesterase
MYLSYKGGRIHYSDRGEGTTIILLHGYLESLEVWNGFADKLANGYRVVAIDLLGHGLSDVYGEIHTMEFMASVVNEVLISLCIDKAFMLGHSLGGYVTLAFVELFPDRLSGYCLFHSQPFDDLPAAIEKRKREIGIVKKGKKNLMYPDNVIKMFASSNLEKFAGHLDKLKTIASEIPGEGIIAMLKGMMIRPSRLAIMEEGRVPCLWILGSMDNYIPCDIIRSKVKLSSDTSVVVLKNSGHLGFIEEEDLSVKIISDFVSNLS